MVTLHVQVSGCTVSYADEVDSSFDRQHVPVKCVTLKHLTAYMPEPPDLQVSSRLS